MFLLQLLLHRLTLIIPPLPPPKKKKLAKLPFCFIRNVREISAKPIAFKRNWLDNICKIGFFNNPFLAKFVPNFSAKFPAKSAVFSANSSLKIPQNLAFFPRHIRGPVLWMVYIIKVLDLVAFFSLSSHFRVSSYLSLRNWVLLQNILHVPRGKIIIRYQLIN